MNIDFKKTYIDVTQANIDQSSPYYLEYISLELNYLTETKKAYNNFKVLCNEYIHECDLDDTKRIFHYPNEIKNKETRTKIKNIINEQNKRLYNYTSSILNLNVCFP